MKNEMFETANIRIVRRDDSPYPIGIGIDTKEFEFMPETNFPKKYALAILTMPETKQLVKNLQKLIKENQND